MATPPRPSTKSVPGRSKSRLVERSDTENSGTAHSRNWWSRRRNGRHIMKIA